MLERRPAAADDEAFLRELYATTRPEVAGWEDEARETFLDLQIRAQRQEWEARFPDRRHEVILLDGHPVGRLWVAWSPTECILVDMTLLPRHRRGGIGTRLVGEVLAEADRRGVPARLTVERTNGAVARLLRSARVRGRRGGPGLRRARAAGQLGSPAASVRLTQSFTTQSITRWIRGSAPPFATRWRRLKSRYQLSPGRISIGRPSSSNTASGIRRHGHVDADLAVLVAEVVVGVLADARAGAEPQQPERQLLALERGHRLGESGATGEDLGVFVGALRVRVRVELSGDSADRAERDAAPVALVVARVEVRDPVLRRERGDVRLERGGVEPKREADAAQHASSSS